MKICVICSPGGHLSQALSVMEAFHGDDCFLVVQDFDSVRDFNPDRFRRTYHLRLLFGYSLGLKMGRARCIWLGVYITLFFNFFSLLRILLKERPDVLFSTGAEIAIPAFYIAKFLLGAKLIFLESIARIKEISSTGRALLPVTDLFLVQWEELAEKYKKARYFGRVL